MKSSDNIGNVLRRFYSMYGRPQEGPPENVDISEIVPEADLDIDLLQRICDNTSIYQEFTKCRDIAENVAARLSESPKLVEELDEVLSQININEYHLSNAIFWYTLALSLDPRGTEQTQADLKLPKEIPLPFRYALQLQGSLIFRLYITLVYMKEGVIQDVLQKGSSLRMPTLILCRQLLNCDYVRRLRNALSHADFETSIAGIVWRDNAVWYGATPGFLDWLCI